MDDYYGVLTGLAYTIPFAFVGIYFGKIVNKVNRKILLSMMLLVAAVSTMATALVNSFLVLAVMRVVLGTVSSAFNPISFSLLSEFIPASRRATANSILQSGNYIGWGISSLSVLTISEFGWRSTYALIGVVSATIALVTLLFVGEPSK